MHRTFYGLTYEPFAKDIEVEHHFESRDFKEVINRLEFLKDTRGIGLLTGEPGMGKSFIVRYFLSTLNPNLYKSVYIPISTLTVPDFYRALCDGLGIAPAYKKIDMFKQIQEALYTYQTSKNITPVIVVDEAQFIKNSILDDLRMILNFDVDSKDCAILLLVGQTPFLTQLSRQHHEALRQRIMVNYYIKGLTKDETVEYVESRLKSAGFHEKLFTQSALELLFTVTNGSMRPINTLAKMCLISGANQKARSIDESIVYAAQSETSITS